MKDQIMKMQALVDNFDKLVCDSREKVLDAVSATKKLIPVLAELTKKHEAIVELFNDIKSEFFLKHDEENEFPISVEEDGQEVIEFVPRNTRLDELKNRAAYVKLLKVMKRQVNSIAFMSSRAAEKVSGMEFPSYFMVQATKLFKIKSMAYLEEYFNELISNGLEWAKYRMSDHKEYVVFDSAKILSEAGAHKL